MPTFTDRLQHAWNAFMGRDPTRYRNYDIGYGSTYRPDRMRFMGGNEKSIISSVYNRIAVDVSAINIEHVRLDENGRFKETIDSGLNNVLTLDANIDQTGRVFVQDIVMSMFDEGCVAVVPVETTLNPTLSGSYDITSMRTGKILEWYPEHIKARLYNDKTGKKEDLILPKKMVAIIENPFYAIMNEPNSTLQRLKRTLNDLDVFNAQQSSGKLDLIIQLPYIVKTEARRQQAEQRRKEIEMQLTGSKYGIAYTDGTEHITQLNRSLENNLWTQAKELTDMLYNQLGLTKAIFEGTADEQTMLNYYNNTITPILSAIAEEFMRKFLTKTARTQRQAIRFFRDPFKLVPVSDLAEIADKFTRNEIASSNEMRSEIGWKPVEDPRADELRNKNISQNAQEMGQYGMQQPGYEQEQYDYGEDGYSEEYEEPEQERPEEIRHVDEQIAEFEQQVNEEDLSELDSLESQIEELLRMLGGEE